MTNKNKAEALAAAAAAEAPKAPQFPGSTITEENVSNVTAVAGFEVEDNTHKDESLPAPAPAAVYEIQGFQVETY